MGKNKYMPKRFKMPSLFSLILLAVVAYFFISGWNNANITFERLFGGIKNTWSFIERAFPPSFERTQPAVNAMIETFEMALIGTIVGVIISLPIAILSSKNTTPFAPIRWVMKSIVSAARTIPDLVWALIFVIAIGLGPLAGIITIIVDTIGFCAKFFSERIEEMDKGSKEALESTGSSYLGVITGSILPQGLPSFTSTSLYALEKAIRGATILGLVGAGGIGMELNASMSLRKYDEALMMILMILIFVIVVENISSRIRQKLI